MINKNRLYQHIEELAAFGQDTNGGISRFPYTQADEDAKNYLWKLMEKAKLIVRSDAVGNLIGTRKGTKKSKILCGSHYDSVKHGGKFDGCLGILAAIEVVQCFEEEHRELPCDIEIIAFKDEEGNRFSTGMVGSRSICGLFDEQELFSKDAQGITLQEAAQKQNYPIQDYKTCGYDFQNIIAYLELHIEQGSVLEKQQRSVGIVEGIAGLKRFEIMIHGVSGHAGATPMIDRVDPVVAFSILATYIQNKICSYPTAVATIGEIHTYPGACNVICEHLTFSLDIRSLSMLDLDEFLMNLKQQITNLETNGYVIEWKETQCLQPSICNPAIMNTIKQAMEDEHLPVFTLMSGAGHDAMNFSTCCPIGMIFVRSEHGYSHHPMEYTSPSDCEDGAKVLYHTLVRLSANNF